MRTRGFTLVQLLVVVMCLVVIAGVLYPIFARPRECCGPITCQSNLKQIMLGLLAYVQDNNERFPPARGNGIKNDPGYGWAGCTQAYLKSTQVLKCPQSTSPAQSTTGASGFSDYYYNLRLTKIAEDKMNYVSNTIAAADGNDAFDVADAAYSKSQLPPNWVTDTGKPTYRHLDGCNYAFADGHIKWLKPTIPTNAAASSSVFTFATK